MISQILSGEHSTFLADQESRGVGVASNIVGANGKISNLQALDAVDIETFVEYTVLDDGISVTRSHGTSSEAVPGGFDVTLSYNQYSSC
jgi:hypothetical protein